MNRVHQAIEDKDKLIFRLMRVIMNDPGLNRTADASHRLRVFLEGVDEFVGGYWRHAVTARRYHGVNFKGAIPPGGHFIYDPEKTVLKTARPYRYRWLREVAQNVQPCGGEGVVAGLL